MRPNPGAHLSLATPAKALESLADPGAWDPVAWDEHRHLVQQASAPDEFVIQRARTVDAGRASEGKHLLL